MRGRWDSRPGSSSPLQNTYRIMLLSFKTNFVSMNLVASTQTGLAGKMSGHTIPYGFKLFFSKIFLSRCFVIFNHKDPKLFLFVIRKTEVGSE